MRHARSSPALALSLVPALALWLAPAGCAGDGGAARGSAAASSTARVVNLAPDFTAESSTTYEHVLEHTEKRAVAGIEEKTLRARIIRTYTLRTLKTTPDGGALIELTFRRVAMRVEPPDGIGLDFDSARPNPGNMHDPRSRILDRLKDVRVTVAVGPGGEPSEVQGLATLDRFAGRTPPSLEPLLDESWFRAAVRDVFGVAGDEPARRVGESWKQRSVTEVGGIEGASSELTYMLASANDERAVIEGVGELTLDYDAEQFLAGSRTAVSDQSYVFTITWSPALGRVSGYSTTQTLDLAIDAQGLVVSLKQRTVGTLRRTAGAAAADATPPGEGG